MITVTWSCHLAISSCFLPGPKSFNLSPSSETLQFITSQLFFDNCSISFSKSGRDGSSFEGKYSDSCLVAFFKTLRYIGGLQEQDGFFKKFAMSVESSSGKEDLNLSSNKACLISCIVIRFFNFNLKKYGWYVSETQAVSNCYSAVAISYFHFIVF